MVLVNKPSLSIGTITMAITRAVIGAEFVTRTQLAKITPRPVMIASQMRADTARVVTFHAFSFSAVASLPSWFWLGVYKPRQHQRFRPIFALPELSESVPSRDLLLDSLVSPLLFLFKRPVKSFEAQHQYSTAPRRPFDFIKHRIESDDLIIIGHNGDSFHGLLRQPLVGQALVGTGSDQSHRQIAWQVHARSESSETKICSHAAFQNCYARRCRLRVFRRYR